MIAPKLGELKSFYWGYSLTYVWEVTRAGGTGKQLSCRRAHPTRVTAHESCSLGALCTSCRLDGRKNPLSGTTLVRVFPHHRAVIVYLRTLKRSPNESCKFQLPQARDACLPLKSRVSSSSLLEGMFQFRRNCHTACVHTVSHPFYRLLMYIAVGRAR